MKILLVALASLLAAGCATFTCPDANPDVEFGVRPNSNPPSLAVRCQGEPDWRIKAYASDDGEILPFVCIDGHFVADGEFGYCEAD